MASAPHAMFTSGLPANMRRVPVDGHVLAIDRRIREGDDVWRGDPSMGLYFDPSSGMWEVWGLDINSEPYRAAVAPYADQRLLDQLVQGDWQRGLGLFEQVEKANEKLRREHEAAEDDLHDEMADRLAHALRKDFGYRDRWSIDWTAKPPCNSPT